MTIIRNRILASACNSPASYFTAPPKYRIYQTSHHIMHYMFALHHSFFAGYGYPIPFRDCTLDADWNPSEECFFAGFGSDSLTPTLHLPSHYHA